MKKMKVMLCWLLTMVIAFCFCLTTVAEEVPAKILVRSFTCGEGVNVTYRTCQVQAIKAMKTTVCSVTESVPNNGNLITVGDGTLQIRESIITVDGMAEESSPFAYPERNKVVTTTTEFLNESLEVIATLVTTVRGVWSQYDGYAIINSVDTSITGDFAENFEVFVTIEGNTARVLVLRLDLVQIVMIDEYELSVNGYMERTQTIYEY